MEDSVKYLTFDRYLELGGTLDQMSFNLLEYKSRKQIDLYTFNRLTDGVPEDIKEDIENAMMILINTNNNIQSNVSNKTSETIDGYSVQYKSSKETDTEIGSQIELLLGGLEKDGVPLTYAGGVNDNKQCYYPIS